MTGRSQAHRLAELRRVADQLLNDELPALATQREVAQAKRRIKDCTAGPEDFALVVSENLEVIREGVFESAAALWRWRSLGRNRTPKSVDAGAAIVSYEPDQDVPPELYVTVQELAASHPLPKTIEAGQWAVANEMLVLLGDDLGKALRIQLFDNLEDYCWGITRVTDNTIARAAEEQQARLDRILDGTAHWVDFMNYHAPTSIEQSKELGWIALRRKIVRESGAAVPLHHPMDHAAEIIGNPPDLHLPEHLQGRHDTEHHLALARLRDLKPVPGTQDHWQWAEAHRVKWLLETSRVRRTRELMAAQLAEWSEEQRRSQINAGYGAFSYFTVMPWPTGTSPESRQNTTFDDTERSLPTAD